MLNEKDIDLINEWRKEMLSNRMRPISVIYLDIERDPLTGLILGETEKPREVKAVVTEISSSTGSNDRTINDGIIYEEGDVKFDVNIESVIDIIDELTRIEYDGNKYEIVAKPKKGLGRRNRYEIHGRLIV